MADVSWEQDNNPIDKNLQTCLNNPENFSTAGMVQCEGQANDAWDKELNTVYKDLMTALKDNPAAQKDLHDSEVSWLKTRDADLKFSSDIYGSKQGTMWRPMAVDAAANITKDRALQLHHRLDVLND